MVEDIFKASLNEECGVAGVWDSKADGNIDATNLDDAARSVFYALFALQHRGQEAAGMAVSNGHHIRVHKDHGLVTNVFNEDVISKLQGHIAIGHTRYSTTGGSSTRNIQPFYIETMYGPIALAHNGNLVNAGMLRNKLLESGVGLSSTSDTEVMVMMLAAAKGDTWPERIANCMKEWVGAFSILLLTKDALYAARDPWGFRPLSVGSLQKGVSAVASESCAMVTIGCKNHFEVQPGEIMQLADDGPVHVGSIPPAKKPASCIFEYVYFARTDTVWNGAAVHMARVNFGKALAKKAPVKADIVIAIPDSSRSAAIGYSEGSGIPYNEGLSKNRYIARTFIQPTQKLREQGVALKFNILDDVVRGKSIVVVDDSIVRGTTIKHLLIMLRNAGAKELHVRISCPPLRHPCYMGVDMGGFEKLIAHEKTVAEICKHINADSLEFLNIDEMQQALRDAGATGDYCLACFNGEYPVDVSATAKKEDFEN